MPAGGRRQGRCTCRPWMPCTRSVPPTSSLAYRLKSPTGLFLISICCCHMYVLLAHTAFSTRAIGPPCVMRTALAGLMPVLPCAGLPHDAVLHPGQRADLPGRHVLGRRVHHGPRHHRADGRLGPQPLLRVAAGQAIPEQCRHRAALLPALHLARHHDVRSAAFSQHASAHIAVRPHHQYSAPCS